MQGVQGRNGSEQIKVQGGKAEEGSAVARKEEDCKCMITRSGGRKEYKEKMQDGE